MYLTNLIVCTVASFAMSLGYMLLVAVVGIPLLGPVSMPVPTLIALMATCLLTNLAFCGLYTMLSMLIQNKAAAAVSILLVCIALFVIAEFVNGSLNEPEFVSNFTATDAAGNIIYSEKNPNPAYLTGTKREVYKFLFDFLPTGQAIQWGNLSNMNLARMALCSVGIAAASTFAGIWFFRKKDIK